MSDGEPQHWMYVPSSRGEYGRVDKLDLVYGVRRTFLHRHLWQHGLRGWQPETTAALLAAWDLCERRTFFDVGANIGVYALLHQHRWPGETSVAFEPTPVLLETSQAMAQRNGLRIRFEAAAVSEADGDATLYVSSRSDTSNSLVAGFRRAKDALTVPTVTIDSYVERTGLVPGVIKIDVETHEAAVLVGATHVLQTYRPVLVVELLHGPDGQPTPLALEVLRILEQHGYESRHLRPPADGEVHIPEIELRDWLFWHGGQPPEFEAAFRAWSTTVARCVPRAGRGSV